MYVCVVEYACYVMYVRMRVMLLNMYVLMYVRNVCCDMYVRMLRMYGSCVCMYVMSVCWSGCCVCYVCVYVCVLRIYVCYVVVDMYVRMY